MSGNQNTEHYLYHIRDPETSFGFGYDGYIGITDNPSRRRGQHFDALKRGEHSNERLQDAYNRSTCGLQYWVLTSGPKEEIEARERLLVPKPNHHLNKQVGGGSQRGMSQDEAIEAIHHTKHPGDDIGPDAEKSTSKKATSISHKPNASAGSGVAAATGADIAATAGLSAAYAASGLGAAYVLNKTVLKDEPTLDPVEKESRKAGRVASYAGGSIGAAGSLALVYASGEVVGLGVAGITSGLTGIGGGVIMGFGITVAAPAVIAVGAGLGVYKLARWLNKPA